MEIPVEFESNGDKIRGVFYATEEQLPAPAVVFLGGFPPAEGDP